MRRYLAAIAVSAVLAFPVLADEVNGVVQVVDLQSRTIALEDGTVYTAAAGVDLRGVAIGASVRLTIDDNTNEVTAIEVRT